jgi:fluoride exporter
VSVGHRAGIVVAVAIGGAVGTVVRYELALAEPVQSGRFPWATFTANLVGSLVLGIAVVVFAEDRVSTRVPRAFVAFGFCGGLTTFSTFSAELVILLQQGRTGWAIAAAGVHLAGSVCMTFAGIGTVFLARKLVG